VKCTAPPRDGLPPNSRRYHWPNANPLAVANHSALIDADDFAGLIAALRLGPVHLVGTSYGAFTALASAIKHPEVRSMVLAEPPVHEWVTGTARGATLYRELVVTAYEPARQAFAAGHDEAAMRIFIDRFDGRGAFDGLSPERRPAVMANARFFKAITSSSDPFPNLSKDAVRRLPIPILIVRGAETDELHRLSLIGDGWVGCRAQSPLRASLFS
jgi:esterase